LHLQGLLSSREQARPESRSEELAMQSFVVCTNDMKYTSEVCLVKLDKFRLKGYTDTESASGVLAILMMHGAKTVQFSTSRVS
jgi:hypothetical protein